MYILGISALYHDSAAVLLFNGKIISAAQEERFSRIKHDSTFPMKSISYLLQENNLSISDVNHVIIYEKPILKFDRQMIRLFKTWPQSFDLFKNFESSWLKKKMNLRKMLRKYLKYEGEIRFCKHHESHAAAAFFTSPFKNSTIVTIDGVGEWATTAIHVGIKNKIETIYEQNYPHSLGLFYSAFTDYLGFQINDGEYKVMGLASYGEPTFEKILRDKIIFVDQDGNIKLNMAYFTFEKSSYMLDFSKIENLLGLKRRINSEELNIFHKNLAASVQKILEDSVLSIVLYAIHKTGISNVCLGGGVALNCRANSMVRSRPQVKNLYIFPAAGDAGAAAGAALFSYYQLENNAQSFQAEFRAELGPAYSNNEIQNYLEQNKFAYEYFDDNELCKHVAKLIYEQKIIGWFQGKMEFGPRALGNRSILGDPRNAENLKKINLMIKYREDFRPLAPSILEEKVSEYFDFLGKSPYMLLTAQNKTTLLPAVTHSDGSSRLHTVSEEQNSLFYRLIKEFEQLSNVPALINTSFNTADMPIVCTPQNAYQAFAESYLDYLVLGNFVLSREKLLFLKNSKNKIAHHF